MRSKQKGAAEGISKGYRLKPETHRMVEKLKSQLKGSKDDVISRACSMLIDDIRKKEGNNK
jgi:hypothetical protein